MDGQAVQDKAISNLRFQILNPVHPVHPCELFLCLFFLAQDAVENLADRRLRQALAQLDLGRDFELREAELAVFDQLRGRRERSIGLLPC